MDLITVRPGDRPFAGGCYVQTDGTGAVRLATWAGATEVALALNADQADALAAQLTSRAVAGVTHAFGAAELCNASFDLHAHTPA